MKKIFTLIEMYKSDAYHFDDFDDDIIAETLDKLKESLSNLKENDNESYARTIKEYKNSLEGERKDVIEDFIEYSKYHNK
jgi:hypothetical protein